MNYLRLELPNVSADRIAETVTKMDTGVAETDSGHRAGQMHVTASFEVVAVIDSSLEVFSHNLKGVPGPDVADGVAALVGRSQDRIRRARRSLSVINRGERLESVTEDVEARVRADPLRKTQGVKRIDDSEGRSKSSIGDTGLGLQWSVVEDRNAGRLGSGTGSRRDRDQRLQRHQHRLSLADRGVHVVKKIGLAVAGVQIRGLASVHYRTTSDLSGPEMNRENYTFNNNKKI